MILVIFCLLLQTSLTPSVLVIRSQLFQLVFKGLCNLDIPYIYLSVSTTYLQTQEVLMSTYKDHAYFSYFAPRMQLCLQKD